MSESSLSSRGQFVRHSPSETAESSQPPADSGPIATLIQHYVTTMERLSSKQHDNQPTVEVNESLGVLAFAYEKLRNSVEYREDHVLLRNAIKRILKRRLNPMWQYESIAAALLRELIWARYLKNDSIPQTKISEIEVLLRKYNVLRQAAQKLPQPEEWQDWILGIAACDIEQVLVRRQIGYALAEVMYQSLLSSVRAVGVEQEDWTIQLYLAVHRTLLKSDKTLLTYHLFLINAAGWQLASEDEVAEFAARLPELRQTIQNQLTYATSQELSRHIKRYAPPFKVLGDIVLAQPGLAMGTFVNPSQLKKKVEEACTDHYTEMRVRVRRAIVRSMIYIFITKMVIALALEIPYDRYFYGEVKWGQLAFNILFPPLFMAVLGLSIRTPGPKNTEAIFQRLLGIISQKYEVETLVLNRARGALAPVMSFIYLLFSLLIFSLVAWGLWKFNFTPLGIGLFLFFFCVVVFFAYRVRQIATEMSVVREKENILEGLVTLITLPFLRIGYRLSAEFGKVNLFAFILDVLLEAPFKLILDLTEHWLNFLRQKREEVIDTHEY